MDAKFFEIDNRMEALRHEDRNLPSEDPEGLPRPAGCLVDLSRQRARRRRPLLRELKAAIDQRIISDVTLIPMYEEVRNHKTAVDFVREASVAKKPPAVDLDLVRKLYALLTPEEAAKGYPYRRENPLHRLYYHEIAAPEKITYRMRKLGEWMESDEFADLHPITRAVKAHFRCSASTRGRRTRARSRGC